MNSVGFWLAQPSRNFQRLLFKMAARLPSTMPSPCVPWPFQHRQAGPLLNLHCTMDYSDAPITIAVEPDTIPNTLPSCPGQSSGRCVLAPG